MTWCFYFSDVTILIRAFIRARTQSLFVSKFKGITTASMMTPKSPFFRPSPPRHQRGPTAAVPEAAAQPVTTTPTNEPQEHKSGVLGTAANLVNAIIGCGIVGIPYAMAQCGIIAGIPLVIFVAVMTEKSLRLLIETATYVRAGSYETLAESCFGPTGHRFVAVNMFITSYGAMVAYLMVVKDCFAGLLLSDEYDTVTLRRSLLLLISLATVVPLACRRDVADLAVTSRLNVIIDTTLVVIVAVNAVQYRSYLHNNSGDTNTTVAVEESSSSLSSHDVVLQTALQLPLLVIFHWKTIFVGLGVMSFAFVCQHAAFIIAGSLQEPQQWSTVTRLALSVCALLALTCGMFGFYGYRNDTVGNILDNLNPNAVSTHLAKLLLGTTMLFVYPLESMVARHVCVTLLFDGWAAHEGNHDAFLLNRRDRRVLLTLAVYVAAIIPAAFFVDLGPVLALTGAIGGSCLSYIGPGAVFLGVHGARFRALVRQTWMGTPTTGEEASSLLSSVPTTTTTGASSGTVAETGEVTRLIAAPSAWKNYNKNKVVQESPLQEQHQLSPLGSLLWTVSGMSLWLHVADIGVKHVHAYAQDLAAKSPHPIRIGGIEYQPKAKQLERIKLRNGPAHQHLLLANGEEPHRLVGHKCLQQPKSTITTRSSSTTTASTMTTPDVPSTSATTANIIDVGWSDFIVAIGYIIFGFVAMVAGIASLCMEEDGR
jgi:solute carrier family 38 (sodium-coupled neutral amino acid transporter), member 11